MTTYPPRPALEIFKHRLYQVCHRTQKRPFKLVAVVVFTFETVSHTVNGHLLIADPHFCFGSSLKRDTVYLQYPPPHRWNTIYEKGRRPNLSKQAQLPQQPKTARAEQTARSPDKPFAQQTYGYQKKGQQNKSRAAAHGLPVPVEGDG